MASEATVASTQTTIVEEVKDKLNEEVEPAKLESDSPPKDSGHQNPKAEELPSVEPSLAKIEETIVDKLIEEPPASVTILSEIEEKTEDKPTVAPVIEEIVKTEDIPVKENSEVAQDLVHEPDTSSVPEAVVDGVKDIKPEEQQATESVNNIPEEQQETDPITKHPEEKTCIVDVSISSVEAIEKPVEPLEVSPIKEPETITVKEREVSEAESIKEETTEPAVPEVKEKPEPTTVAEVEEKTELATAEVEKISEPTVAKAEEKPDLAVPTVEEKPEPAVAEMEEKPEAAVPEVEVKPEEQPIVDNGSVPGEKEKKEVPLPDKFEDITILKENNISKDQEVFATESSDQAVSTYQEAQYDSKGDEGNTTPSVAEKVGEVNIEKEASEVSFVEGLLKEAVVELAKDEPIKVEDVDNAVCMAEVTTSGEGENKSRDVELLPENKKEDIEDEKPTSVEVNKEEATEETLSENTTAVNKQVVEPQDSKLEVKAEEAVRAEGDKLEEEEVDDADKLHVPNMEPSSKLGDDIKPADDLPKEVPAKPIKKQSNTILTKVKKTIVKAKKAILGKSPSSKTIIAETKGDIEVK